MHKQTQTKLFDFSDVGLDFCAGSKNLFPDRFKKMLSQGYNEQTASSVSISGSIITLTYGVTHGYVADRVLQVTAAGGFNKEVYIDSVTENTVTCTVLDDDTTDLSGAVTTKVASLGWELLYEQDNIHVYKMLHIDDTPRYVRFCFQNNATHRNAIAVCIGKTWDSDTGFIDDSDALQGTKDVMSPSAANLPRWDFQYSPTNSYNVWTYSQGYNTFGRGCFVGSRYHFAMLNYSSAPRAQFNAILPVSVFDYDLLQYPLIMCSAHSTATSSSGAVTSVLSAGSAGRAYIGNTRCRFDIVNYDSGSVLSTTLKGRGSALPSNIDNFNTTTCIQMPIYENGTTQFLGYCLGAYIAMYANNSIAPNLDKTILPLVTADIDLNSRIVVHDGAGESSKASAVYVALPLEEVKIA